MNDSSLDSEIDISTINIDNNNDLADVAQHKASSTESYSSDDDFEEADADDNANSASANSNNSSLLASLSDADSDINVSSVDVVEQPPPSNDVPTVTVSTVAAMLASSSSSPPATAAFSVVDHTGESMTLAEVAAFIAAATPVQGDVAVTCECGVVIAAAGAAAHRASVCAAAMLACALCGSDVARGDSEKHATNECEMRRAHCPFKHRFGASCACAATASLTAAALRTHLGDAAAAAAHLLAIDDTIKTVAAVAAASSSRAEEAVKAAAAAAADAAAVAVTAAAADTAFATALARRDEVIATLYVSRSLLKSCVSPLLDASALKNTQKLVAFICALFFLLLFR
jgi:hypothetical protein